MQVEMILKDLRQQFGKKSVLYAEDIAEVLGISLSASYSLKSRGGLNLPVVETGGRAGVSIYAVAEWLAGVDESSVKARKASKAQGLLEPTPKRRIAGLEKGVKVLQLQSRFLNEVVAGMEHNILDLTIQAAAKKDRKVP